MARITFTSNLARHLSCPPVDAPGGTVREVLDRVFEQTPLARTYVLDDQAALRTHMAVFNGNQIGDRVSLSDPVPANGEVYVLQALSGG